MSAWQSTREPPGPPVVWRARDPRAQVPRSALTAAAALLAGTLAAVWVLFGLVTGPPSTAPPGPVREAAMEDGLEGFEYVNTSGGELEVQYGEAADGRGYAAAVVRPPFEMAVARGAWSVDWEAGDTVCYGLSIRFRTGLFDTVEGLDVMRWDNFDRDPRHPDQGGLTVRADGRANVFVERAGTAGTYSVLGSSGLLPTGRWVRLVVQQHLSTKPDEASTVLFLNGDVQASSGAPNAFDRGIDFLRAGVVGAYGVRGDAPLRVDVDDVFFAARPCSSADQ